MLVEMKDETVKRILVLRKLYEADQDAAFQAIMVEGDRLVAEGSGLAVMAIALGGMLMSDTELKVVKET